MKGSAFLGAAGAGGVLLQVGGRERSILPLAEVTLHTDAPESRRLNAQVYGESPRTDGAVRRRRELESIAD